MSEGDSETGSDRLSPRDDYTLPGRSAPPGEWVLDALCREYPKISFFPARGDPSAPAKKICARCLVRDQGFDYAVTTTGYETKYGIWGGTSERQRRRLRNLSNLNIHPAPTVVKTVAEDLYDHPWTSALRAASRLDLAVEAVGDALDWLAVPPRHWAEHQLSDQPGGNGLSATYRLTNAGVWAIASGHERA